MSIEKKITITIDAKNAKRQLKAMNKLIADNAKAAKKAADATISSNEKAEKSTASSIKTTKEKATAARVLGKAEVAAYKESESFVRKLGLAEIAAYKQSAAMASQKLSEVRKLTLAQVAAHKEGIAIEKKKISQTRTLSIAEINAYKESEAAVRKKGLAEIAAYKQVSVQAKNKLAEVRTLGLAEVAAYKQAGVAANKKSALSRRVGLAEVSAYQMVAKSARSKALAEIAAYKSVEVAARRKAISSRRLALAEVAAYKEAEKRANTSSAGSSITGRAVAAVSVAVTARQLVTLVDGYAEFTNRLRTATKSEKELLEVQKQIVEIAKETRTGLEENGLLYLRLAKATDNAGTSSAELLKITSTVNKAVQIGGSSAQEAAGAIRQFTQIISAGFSSGFSQEINSLAEQTPGLFDVIVDGLRETSQEFRDLEDSGMSGIKILKEFSEKGIGNLDMLLEAVSSQTSNVNKEFLAIRPTITKSINVFRTSLQAYIGAADQANGTSSKLANGIETLADNIHLLAGASIVAGGAISGILLRSITATSIAMFKATVVAKGFWASLNPIAAVAGAVAGLVLAFVSIKAPVASASNELSDFAVAVDLANKALNTLSERELRSSIKATANEIAAINKELSSTGVANKQVNTYAFKYGEALADAERYKTALNEIISREGSEGQSEENFSRERQWAEENYREKFKIVSFYGDKTLAYSEEQTEKALSLLERLSEAELQLQSLTGEKSDRTDSGKEAIANAEIKASEIKNSKLLTIQEKYGKLILEAQKRISAASEGEYKDRGRADLKVIVANRDAEVEALKEDNSAIVKAYEDLLLTKKGLIEQEFELRKKEVKANFDDTVKANSIIVALEKKKDKDIAALSQENKTDSEIKSYRDMLLTKTNLAKQEFKIESGIIQELFTDKKEANKIIAALQVELTKELAEIRQDEIDKAFSDNQKANSMYISQYEAFRVAIQKSRDEADAKEEAARTSGVSRIEFLKESFMEESKLVRIKADEDIAIVNKYGITFREKRLLIVAIEKETTEKLAAIRKEESLQAFSDNQERFAVEISALREYNDLRLLAIKDAKEKEEAARKAGLSRVDALKQSFIGERELIIAKATEDVAAASKYIEDAEEKRALIVAIERAMYDELNEIRDSAATKEHSRAMASAELASQAAAGVMGLIGTMSSLKQEAIDKELSSNKVFTKEQRKNKEMEAERAFDSNQNMIKATIAMQTGLAIIGALADPSPNFWVKAANATIAATTGAASYAKANAQSYNAPSAPSNATPSAASSSSGNSTVSNNTSSTTINVNAGNSSPTAIAAALQSYINDNDGIIINPDSSQGRLLNA